MSEMLCFLCDYCSSLCDFSFQLTKLYCLHALGSSELTIIMSVIVPVGAVCLVLLVTAVAVVVVVRRRRRKRRSYEFKLLTLSELSDDDDDDDD